MRFADTDTFKGATAAFIGFTAFAFGDVVFKLLGPYYSIFTMGFYTSLFATIGMIAAAHFNGGLKKALKTDKKKYHLIRGVLMAVQFLCIIYAFNQMTMAKTYSLVFIAPFLASIFAIPILKEHIPPRRWFVVLAGLSGVIVILRPGMIPFDPAALAALCAATGIALSNITARFIGKNDSPYSFGLYVEMVILPLTFIMALTDFTVPSLPHMTLLALSGFCGAAGIIFVAKGFTLAPASVAAPIHYVQILWAILFGYLLFGDALDPYTAVGATIIIGSGLWLVRQEQYKIPDTGSL